MKIEQLLKQSFQNKLRGKALQRGPDCPSEEHLSLYMENRLSKDERGQIESHLADCPYCLDLVVVAKKAVDAAEKGFNLKSILLKQKWLILGLVSLVLSFVFSRYFLQFLVATLILGIKWAVGSDGAKNLVMIFRSMHSHEEPRKQDREFEARK